MVGDLNHNRNGRVHLIRNSEHTGDLVGGFIRRCVNALQEIMLSLHDTAQTCEVRHWTLRNDTDFSQQAEVIIMIVTLHLRNHTNI